MDARVEHDLPARFRQNITWIDEWVVTSVQVAGGDEHGESERVLGVKLVFCFWPWATCLAAGRPLLSRVVRLRVLSIFGNHSESGANVDEMTLTGVDKGLFVRVRVRLVSGV